MEPVSLAAVGAVALTEGIKFLYGQAGEVIRWWRTHKDEPAEDDDRLPLSDAGALDGQLAPAVADRDVIMRLDADIRSMRVTLGPYVDEMAPEPVDQNDPDLIAVVNGLRLALEAVLGQPIRFVGESLERPGISVTGEVDIQQVAGYVAGVRARNIEGGRLVGRVRSGSVEAGGQAYGVDVEETT